MLGNNNFIMRTMVFTAALIICTNVQARPQGGMEIDYKLLERAADDLGLSDDVLEKVKAASYEADRAAIEIRSKLDRARLDFQQMMSSDNPSEKKMMELVEEMGGLETNLRKNRIGLLLKVRPLLTKEQRKKLKKILRKERKRQRGERGEKRRQRREHKQGGGPMNFDTGEQGSGDNRQRGEHQRRR
ncbi:MAG: hypothetical protein QGI45_09655 [Myxococcota bacterium]|jgi:Spy/CpxP family protein refolding chaperone|nr:hypothetical protein [Myxococcota bacterium]